jgi:hypothetical protein
MVLNPNIFSLEYGWHSVVPFIVFPRGSPFHSADSFACHPVGEFAARTLSAHSLRVNMQCSYIITSALANAPPRLASLAWEDTKNDIVQMDG